MAQGGLPTGGGSWRRLTLDPIWWLVLAAGLLHTALHYATYVPAIRELLQGLPYFNLHAVHEAEFIAVIAFAAYRYRVRGGVVLLAFTAAASVPFILTPYIVGREPRPFEVRDLTIEVVFVLGVGAFVTFLSELLARAKEARERALARAEASNERLTALYEAGRALAEAPTLAEAPGVAARAVVARLGPGCAAAVYLFSPDADTYLLAGRDGLSAGAARAMNTLRGAKVHGLLGLYAQAFGLTMLPEGLAPLAQGLAEQGLASCVAAPLRVQGEWVGLLVAAFRAPAVASEDMNLIGGIAQQTAQAIRNAQLYESERHERAVAESLVRSLRAQMVVQGAPPAGNPSA